MVGVDVCGQEDYLRERSLGGGIVGGVCLALNSPATGGGRERDECVCVCV